MQQQEQMPAAVLAAVASRAARQQQQCGTPQSTGGVPQRVLHGSRWQASYPLDRWDMRYKDTQNVCTPCENTGIVNWLIVGSPALGSIGAQLDQPGAW
jgi:hypothetical protein